MRLGSVTLGNPWLLKAPIGEWNTRFREGPRLGATRRLPAFDPATMEPWRGKTIETSPVRVHASGFRNLPFLSRRPGGLIQLRPENGSRETRPRFSAVFGQRSPQQGPDFLAALGGLCHLQDMHSGLLHLGRFVSKVSGF